MNVENLYRSALINILLAVLLGLFVIFPDVIRMSDSSGPSSVVVMERPAPDMSNHPPPRNNVPRDDGFSGNGAEPVISNLLFFILLSWGLLLINNPRSVKGKEILNLLPDNIRTFVVILLSFIVCATGIYVSSFFENGNVGRNGMPWYANGILIFRGIFVFLSVTLMGLLFKLMDRQHQMIVENEKLKTESLQYRFDALNMQISPHFFFNSLNSLSGLIRENHSRRALKYIKEISNIFRYMLQANWQVLVPLEEEIRFMEAYQYMLNVKYGNKLSFIIDEGANSGTKFSLPSLSVLPLMENIVKHNIISDSEPMTIKVCIREHRSLVVTNSYQPIKDIDRNTGIGLSNLGKRYKHLTGEEINYYIENGTFVVELPLFEKDGEL